ncbi:mitochondrial carrier [Rhodotorula sp. JG-1b]|nr:mitochondrial carrier [Rhodotorula sp. JG-1b]
MGTSSSKVSETQRLLGGGGDDSDARFAAAATVPPPSADYGTTSPPRSASPPATRKTSRASRRGLEPARRSELSEEEDDSDDDGTNSESLTSETVPSPSERRRTVLRFILLWSSVSAVTIYLIVEAFRRGGGEFDWKGALKKAAGGGIAGAMAMVIQVLTLMPLRTIMNYQYRHGKTTTEASKTLYAEGGLPRFWAGLPAALVQGPVARFGDTASQAGIFALLASNPFLSRLPSPLKTVFASLVGALFRMVLMPIDALKTTMQTDGTRPALRILGARVKKYGPATLWAGAFATAAANFVGSWPWFATYNVLSANLPMPQDGHVWAKLARQAFIGFVASVVSDTCSNSLRVIKTYRQVHRKKVSYRHAAQVILRTEGAKGLFGRGLKTRYLANGLQGLLFSVLWKAFADLLDKRWSGGGDGGDERRQHGKHGSKRD